MKSIFLYRDEGVSPSSLRATVRSLQEVTSHPIRLVNRATFLEKDWEELAAMIVIPGGRDLPYVHALQGRANRRIRDYVIHGGRYLGICAGAYYGSASICFEKGGNLEIIGPRELSLFPGQAIGPALGLGEFAYENSQGARITTLALSNHYFKRPRAKAYYHGGCTFLHTTSYPEVTVLAQYEELEEKSPAIILCQVGQGKAILSGVHPEYRPKDLRLEEKKIQTELILAESERKHLFSRLIELAFLI
jgi:glutamine amidotransferase-like uncharacterized protein